MSRKAFHRISMHLAETRGADLFLSGAGYPDESRSLCAIDPVAELRIDANTTVDEIKSFCFQYDGPTLGWFGYAFGMRLRGVQSYKNQDGIQGHLKQYAGLLVHDAQNAAQSSPSVGMHVRNEEVEGVLRQACAQALPPLPDIVLSQDHISCNLSQSEYMDRVRQTLEHIRQGHTYQLNLSMQCSRPMSGVNPVHFFASLLHRHPAPFYTWFSTDDQRFLSTSPERFLKVRNGQVLSQPIKGTLRVSADIANDKDALRSAKHALTSSPKEDAELSMIVDLIRNDISHHCEYGSVRVEGHKSVFQVDDLLQMYSNVLGELRTDSDCLDLFFDAFPGGSITGCPKRRSMRIIDTLEPHSRGIYCGSFVIIEDEQTMDSSIAIRTASLDTTTKSLIFQAGSGIVKDSDAAAEYCETMAKAGKFLGECQ